MLPSRDLQRIPWQRYWAKHDGSMRVDDLGYLIPPSRDRRFNLQPDVFTYEEVASKPFLSLMGETGSGKSDAIVELGHALTTSGSFVKYVTLELIDSSETLRSQLEPAKLAAQAGTKVTLLFDQYEVSGLGEVTYKHIAHEVSTFPLDKTRIRLGCRSGSWSTEMERRFLQIWPDALALELGPLTRDEVLLALSAVRNAPTELLRELEERELVPLLTQPVTLRLIMGMIKRGEDLSKMTASEFYRKGVQVLLRPVRDQPCVLEESDRFAVARRLAAVSIFCRKHVVSNRPDDGKSPVGVLYVKEVARGSEPRNEDDTVNVSDAAVREVLQNTGLFNSRGTDRYGWVHASFAEFLAVDYLRTRQTPAEQTRGLLCLRADGNLIIPELQGVVRWLLSSELLPFGNDFIKKWPTTVLRSDVRSLTDSQIMLLVDALLEAADRGVLDIFSMIVRMRLAKLRHPSLGSQIGSCFHDKRKSERARGLAMRIASACRLNELAVEIADVALDKTEALDIRKTAAFIAAEMGNEAAHQALRPLVDPGEEADVEDDLRGSAFRALWPKHLTSVELFHLLPDPRNGHYFGMFALFLHELPGKLGVQDLEPALLWASSRTSSGYLGRVGRVVDGILSLALAHLDQPAVLQRVGDIIIARAKAHERLYSVESGVVSPLNSSARQVLAEHLAGRMPADELLEILLWESPCLLEPEDAFWLISKMREQESGAWADILVTLLRGHPEVTADHLKALWEVAERTQHLRDVLTPLLGPVKIDSPEADQARKVHERRRPQQVHAAADPEAAKRQAIVEAVLNGRTVEFIHLGYALGAQGNLGLDLVELSGWQQLSPEQQQRTREVALEFLSTQEDERAQWLGANRYPSLAIAGYRALRLLRHDPGALEDLPGDVWKRWVGIAIGMPFNEHAEREAQQDFVRHAGRLAKDVLHDALRTLIASDEVREQHERVLALFPVPWADELVGLVEDVVHSDSTRVHLSLLEALWS